MSWVKKLAIVAISGVMPPIDGGGSAESTSALASVSSSSSSSSSYGSSVAGTGGAGASVAGVATEASGMLGSRPARGSPGRLGGGWAAAFGGDLLGMVSYSRCWTHRSVPWRWSWELAAVGVWTLGRLLAPWLQRWPWPPRRPGHRLPLP